MASDQLRKKWGTIFMGEREASPQQLDAMQEPLLRERAQHQQQEDYLARVRARAEERAREILGAAYAERQKVLEEAGVEAQARVQQFTHEAQALRAQAQSELAEAEAERGKASELREEAEIIRNNAHNNGFQSGMEQAGAELKEFRADVGQMLGNTLQALDAQRHSLVEAWRSELAELARVAVEAGTGWILQTEHKNILQHLVFSSLQLLEDRSTVTLRVHPDDEETVSDLFRAARERVPELNQWIVNGDASVEAGGLVAESVSGSVENLRAYYREMVNGILEHLTLPQGALEEQAGQTASAVAARELARLAEVVPPRPAPVGEMPVLLDDETDAEHEPQPLLASTTPQEGETAPESAMAMEPAADGEAAPGASDAQAGQPAQSAPAVHDSDAGAPQQSGQAAMPAPEAASVHNAAPAREAVPGHDQSPMSDPLAASDATPRRAQEGTLEPANAPAATPDDGIHSAAAQADAAPAHDAPAAAGTEPAAPSAEQPEFAAEPPAPHQPDTHEHQAANPSLAELEDELFPLPEEEELPERQQASSVFVSGGFLPGSGNGQPE